MRLRICYMWGIVKKFRPTYNKYAGKKQIAGQLSLVRFFFGKEMNKKIQVIRY